MFQRALRRSNASVMVTRDPGSRAGTASINTGVMLVRRDADGKRVLDELWRRATAPRDDGVSLAFDPQSRGCLHEQQALQEMLESSAYWRARVAVLEQREDADADADARTHPDADETRVGEGTSRWNLNTFLRWTHRAEDGRTLRYDADAAGSAWQGGDFSGHCSGLSPVRRALCVAALLAAVIS